eukprot:5851465-Karenia_brevis.AAC.1
MWQCCWRVDMDMDMDMDIPMRRVRVPTTRSKSLSLCGARDRHPKVAVSAVPHLPDQAPHVRENIVYLQE